MHSGKVVMHSFLLLVLFLAAAIFVNPLTDAIEDDLTRVAVKEILRMVVTVGLLFLYARIILKKQSTYFRIQKSVKPEKLWFFVGMTMPISIIAFYLFTPFIIIEKQNYILNTKILTLTVQSFITACSAGIIEELLFRGFLFKIIEDKWNVITAICANSIIFGALHLLTVSGLQLNDMLLVLFSISLVGVMLSLIVYKTGNVWNAVIVHMIWNFIMNSPMLQFSSLSDESHSLLLTLRFKSENIWITGGEFGVEAALPTIILYLIIIGWVILLKSDAKNYKCLENKE